MSGSLAPVDNPYPGLRPFRRGEEHLFFGREREVDSMIDRLAATHFLAVVGASGSGKSSLVEVGLGPALHRGLMASAGARWRVIKFRPGGNAVRELAQALSLAGDLFPYLGGQAFPVADALGANLRQSTRGLFDVLTQAVSGPNTNLLIFVDQFEELFRYESAGLTDRNVGLRQEAAAFVNLLLEIPRQTGHRFHVVITLRSDFLGDCARFNGLPEAINIGQYLVPRMTREERKVAVVGPGRVGGAEVSRVLLTRLLNDGGDSPDQLSILQHALNRTWLRWLDEGAQGPITLDHYEAVGTMAEALDRHAEQAYTALNDPSLLELCRKIFQTITDKVTDPRGTRRPTRLGDVCRIVNAPEEQVRKVIDAFRTSDRPFLAPALSTDPGEPDPLDADAVLDIAHESLLGVWKRLQGWAEDEAKSAHLFRDLARDANEGRSYWRDPELQMGLDWWEKHHPTQPWADRYAPGSQASRGFLQASDSDRRRTRRNRRLIAGGIGLLVLLVSGQQYLNVQSRANQLEEINRELEGRIAILSDDIPFIADSVQEIVGANEDLRFNILKRRQDNQILTSEIGALRFDIDGLSQNAGRLVKDTTDVVSPIALLTGNTAQLEARLPLALAERDSLGARLDEVLAVNDSLRRELLLLRRGVLPTLAGPPGMEIDFVPRVMAIPERFGTYAPITARRLGTLESVVVEGPDSLLGELVDLLVQTKTLEAVVQMLNDQNRELISELSGLDDQNAGLNETRNQLSENRTVVMDRVTTLADRRRVLFSRRDSLFAEVEVLQRRVSNTEAKIVVLTAVIGNLLLEREVLEAALAQEGEGR